MLRAVFGIAAKAAVLLLGLSGTQRKIRLTATVALLDIALLPQEIFPHSAQAVEIEHPEVTHKPEVEPPTVVSSTQTSLDWFTLLGIVTFTHLVDVGMWWLSIFLQARRQPVQAWSSEHGNEPIALSFLL